MRRKDLYVFFGLELFAIVWAGAVFSILSSKIVAGGLAGGYFVLSGVFMLWRANRWPEKWRSPTWYVLFVHVFGVALPMLISRFTNVDLPFEEVTIWGLRGPVFHQVSTAVFSVLIFATIVDVARTFFGGTRERGSRKT